jgi:hypothetical protein
MALRYSRPIDRGARVDCIASLQEQIPEQQAMGETSSDANDQRFDEKLRADIGARGCIFRAAFFEIFPAKSLSAIMKATGWQQHSVRACTVNRRAWPARRGRSGSDGTRGSVPRDPSELGLERGLQCPDRLISSIALLTLLRHYMPKRDSNGWSAPLTTSSESRASRNSSCVLTSAHSF